MGALYTSLTRECILPDIALKKHCQLLPNVVNIHDINSFFAQIIQK